MPYAAKYAHDKPSWDVWQDGRNGRWFIVCYVRLHQRYEAFDSKDYDTEDEAWSALDRIERTRNANVTH